MYIISNNKKIEIKNKQDFIGKLIGLMFKKNINYGILLRNCNSIHTFFCFANLDIIMVDEKFNIIHIYNNVKPNKIILPKKNVKHIIEIPSDLSSKDIKIIF